MAVLRYLCIVAGVLVGLVAVAGGSYHYGYTSCYRELNRLNRNDVGNLLAPGDDTMIIRDMQRECMDLESQLIASQREVDRLRSIVNQHETQLTQD